MSDEDSWVEATGPTLDDAIDTVLDMLDLDEDDAEIDVLASGRGRGGQPGLARVRARPRLVAEPAAPRAADGDDDLEDEVTDEELLDAAQSFADGLLESFELSGEAESWIDEDGVLRVEFSGPELGILIGRRGRTLQNLAEIVRTAIQRQTGARTRLFVDVEGYRSRRRAALSEYATRLARQVVESGVELALEPMPAGDRKVVHDAVTPIDGASTLSEGEEPHRYVVISPTAVSADAGGSRPRRGRRRR